jgi:sporulation protein YunB
MLAGYQAHLIVTHSVNRIITQELSRSDREYDNLARIMTDTEGNITGIEMNIIAVNRLKANILTQVADELNGLTRADVSIPIGTLMDWQIFSGRGPRIPFKIIPAGYVEGDVRRSFEAVGINQARHEITLDINVTVTAIIPGYRTTSPVSTSYCIAETVIVGSVPDSFTEIVIPNDIFGSESVRNYGALN